MIRIANSSKASLLRLAELTGDTLSFADSDALSLDGLRRLDFIDVTVSGDAADEERFWTAFRAYGYVASKYDKTGEFIGLVRQVTDEEIAETYAKPN